MWEFRFFCKSFIFSLALSGGGGFAPEPPYTPSNELLARIFRGRPWILWKINGTRGKFRGNHRNSLASGNPPWTHVPDWISNKSCIFTKSVRNISWVFERWFNFAILHHQFGDICLKDFYLTRGGAPTPEPPLYIFNVIFLIPIILPEN